MVNYRTFLKTQFPKGIATETFPAFYSNDMKKFIDFNLDIGWVLQKTSSKRRKEHDRQIYKQYMGIVYCINNSCPLSGKEQ
jgi:hypothetical protein